MRVTSSKWHMVHVHNKWPLNWRVFFTRILHIYYMHNHCLCVEPSTRIHQWVQRCTIINTVVQSSTPLYRHQHHCTVINTVVQSSNCQHRCAVLRFNTIGLLRIFLTQTSSLCTTIGSIRLLRDLPHSQYFLWLRFNTLESWRIFVTQGYSLWSIIQYDLILM